MKWRFDHCNTDLNVRLGTSVSLHLFLQSQIFQGFLNWCDRLRKQSGYWKAQFFDSVSNTVHKFCLQTTDLIDSHWTEVFTYFMLTLRNCSSPKTSQHNKRHLRFYDEIRSSYFPTLWNINCVCYSYLETLVVEMAQMWTILISYLNCFYLFLRINSEQNIGITENSLEIKVSNIYRPARPDEAQRKVRHLQCLLTLTDELSTAGIHQKCLRWMIVGMCPTNRVTIGKLLPNLYFHDEH